MYSVCLFHASCVPWFEVLQTSRQLASLSLYIYIEREREGERERGREKERERLYWLVVQPSLRYTVHIQSMDKEALEVDFQVLSI